MKKLSITFATLVLLIQTPLYANDLVIESFDTNGRLSFHEISTASWYRVEWASALNGPWNSSWELLSHIPAYGSGVATSVVPMYYRVVATLTNGLPTGMIPLPAASFLMGNATNVLPAEGESDELPQHQVTLTGFYIGATEVTKAQWDTVADWATTNGYDLASTNSTGKETNHPACNITWFNCIKWCNAKSEMEGYAPCYYTDAAQTNIYRMGDLDLSIDAVNWSANGYRLPTEAEWEYAARGGASGMRFPWAETNTISYARANYYANSCPAYDESCGQSSPWNFGNSPYTSPAGSLPPNGFGLYDVAGNVSEWCWDMGSADYYSTSPAFDPRGPTNDVRVVRSGDWTSPAYGCRVACRNFASPYISTDAIGFRIAKYEP